MVNGMSKKILITGIIFVLTFSGCLKLAPIEDAETKLIVGIVVDQMKLRYLQDFSHHFGKRGFNRLTTEGLLLDNFKYNYVPTATAPGHASIYTGTTPSEHGIINNYWFDRKLNRQVYCLEDSSVSLVSSEGIVEAPSIIGPFYHNLRSPKNILMPTITDRIKEKGGLMSKVISISLKDRGAIIPGGQQADYAFWYDEYTGEFVTSTFYSDTLPDWLVHFNRENRADKYLNLIWNTLHSANWYHAETASNEFEVVFKGMEISDFPYDLKMLRRLNGENKLLPSTPFGNSYTTDLAIACINGENLGNNNEIDFLAISYSSTDKIGHKFGTRSMELEDTYARLDLELARLLDHLDENVGENKYTLFLTADHGAADNPPYLSKHGFSAGFYSPEKIKDTLEECLSAKLGMDSLVKYVDNYQIYMSTKLKIDSPLKEEVMDCLDGYAGLKEIVWPLDLVTEDSQSDHRFIENGFYKERSGDIVLIFDQGWMSQRAYGTTHGSHYEYDVHVPCIWFGNKVPSGMTSSKAYAPTSIAPTLSTLLNLPLPDSNSVIEELNFKE